jgi:hypothetical protein
LDRHLPLANRDRQEVARVELGAVGGVSVDLLGGVASAPESFAGAA